MSKICIISHYADSLINFRGELIEGMVDKGYRVKAFAPEPGFKEQINNLGAEYETIPLDRTGMNPFVDFKTIVSLIRKLRKFDPDIIFSYAIKPVIYGGLASRLCGVENINSLIPGAGVLFKPEKRKSKLFKLVKFLYKLALKKNNVIFFQNPDDQELFQKMGLISAETKSVVVSGSGVNTEYFNYEKPKNDPISFLIMARLIEDKGIIEFIEAADMLKDNHPDVKFNILGPFDINPTAIKEDEIKYWEKQGVINYLGAADDVRPYLKECSVFVLPSYYREGTPRSILEAMSTGRAIITTDSVGCRETVDPGSNGFLVSPRNSKELAEAMKKFINNAELIEKMGRASRKIAEEKYDVYKVNEKMYKEMGI